MTDSTDSDQGLHLMCAARRLKVNGDWLVNDKKGINDIIYWYHSMIFENHIWFLKYVPCQGLKLLCLLLQINIYISHPHFTLGPSNYNSYSNNADFSLCFSEVLQWWNCFFLRIMPYDLVAVVWISIEYRVNWSLILPFSGSTPSPLNIFHHLKT